MSWSRMWSATGLLALLVLAGGCSDVAYYWQAGMGQWEIVRKRRPIEEVLADPATPPHVAEKLRLVLRVQAFGTTALGLPASTHYYTYADLERDVVTWLVVASEPFAFQEYRHCFLVVGCLGYRGFFAREDADALAAELGGEGYDVLVRPVYAYSTLGWFDDPVLNTFLRHGQLTLMATILHEQAHGLLFVKGDTAFNESFASFVEEEGLRRFLSADGADGARLLARHEAVGRDTARFRAIVFRGRERLERLYASRSGAEGKTRKDMVAEKARLFALLRQDYEMARDSFTMVSYDGWFARDLNNAHLVGFNHYRSWVRAFRTVFEREGRDFPRFFAAVEELSRLSKDQRDQRLNALEEASLADAPYPRLQPHAAP